ncbi:hypothetical protein AEGHOMDF_5136 [Methylobacterium soli]|nr:hypothetical protein AEGHOMDF_5136 [Methylobacterium soli]
MEPLFSPSCQLVGWITPDAFVWDTQMNPVAFLAGENAWTMRTLAWLGPVQDLTCMDQSGKPVAWSSSGSVCSMGPPLRPITPLRPLNPLKPLKPLNPLQPLRPLTPLGGWSRMTFQQWLAGQ